MCPELWLRKFVTSPVTQISPTCCSSSFLICHVSSVTDNTLRAVSRGNSSPNSHCDLTGLAIVQLRQVPPTRVGFSSLAPSAHQSPPPLPATGHVPCPPRTSVACSS